MGFNRKGIRLDRHTRCDSLAIMANLIRTGKVSFP
jgi:hypothetical protein